MRRSNALRANRRRSAIDDMCDLDLLPLVKDDPTAGGPADRLTSPPSSIIRDACEPDLLPPVEDEPSKGGPADRDFRTTNDEQS